jgi:hypothetical protein
MIWPKAYNTFVRSSTFVIFFTTSSTHVLHTCHKHKKKRPLAKHLLHGKTTSIEISSFNNLIKCLWMSSKHEIEHAWIKTNVLQNKHSLWQNMLCNKEWSTTLFCYATRYELYTINKHGIVSKFRAIKPQHIHFNFNIINKNNIKHPIVWHMFRFCSKNWVKVNLFTFCNDNECNRYPILPFIKHH